MKYQEIDYIIEEEFKDLIITETEEIKIYKTKDYLNKLFKEHLSDINIYKRMVYKKIKISIRPPIYLDEKLLLWLIKDKTTIYYINYLHVCSIIVSNKNLIISFFSNNKIIIDYERKKYLRDKDKIIRFINYINQTKDINISINHLI